MLRIITISVGQRESEDVNERGSDKEMAANSAVVQDITKDGQEESPEIIEQIPSSESNLEELTQPAESQTNDVGFKKVFKFVGFKFTVKKDKNEKSDTVQLLTVRKEDGEGAGESDGAGDHQEPSREAGEAAPKESELKQSTEKPQDALKAEPSGTEISLQAEPGHAAEEGRDGEKQEREPTKSPDSPTSPGASETASPFKKFFTQGWAGWRKKTSFRKPREDELEALERKRDQEPERADAEEKESTEETSEKPAAVEQPPPRGAAESLAEARLSAEYEKVELPPEDQAQGPPEARTAPLATEIFDEKVEVVAEVHVSTTEGTEEQKAQVEATEEAPPAEKLAEASAGPQEAEPPEEVKTKAAGAPGGDHTQPPEPGPDEKAPAAQPEGLVSEAEALASQERVKVQGSPLKKLFTSTGLKKLSGKKQKVKRGEEEPGEHQAVQADSADSADEQKGESSASSPDEPEETCLEKGKAAAPQDGEIEEGTTSDGEKKREGGVTPWASFKKMVTPKKRVRRLSESDREDDDLDKVKSATLSSAESGASEVQEEGKGHGDEPKPEEPKRKVDTSVSWEALICVGSSKKRARKASSSDEEGGPRPMAGDSQKPEEAARDREAGPDAAPAGAQEHEPGQGSSSPEQAGSPSEGEGVSTWESFKRLVTPRKKSKSKLEERSEDAGAGAGAEPSAAEGEAGKEESWVSIKKFIPGRRKKRSDGKQDQGAPEDTGPAEATEDDSDVPAVVPLSEYDAVERETTDARDARASGAQPEPAAAVAVSEELSKGLVHTVTVAVIDGARAVTNIEERSPSWISASATEPLDPPAGEVLEREVRAEETPIVTKTLPESYDAAEDTITSEVELTSEAVTAAETTDAFSAEEVAEVSGAEETTDMVSAVSQLSDSPDTTEEATPVQEAEGGLPDVEDQQRRTQEVLQAVAEKVREETRLPEARGQEDMVPTTQRVASRLPAVEEAEEDSQVPDLKGEMEVARKGHVEETTQGKGVGQAAPGHLEEVPEVTEGVSSSELIASRQAEALAGVKSEIVLEQAIAPDSAETLTDSETSGSTPVADGEAGHATQQDEVMGTHADDEVVSGTESQVPGAEAPPAHSGFQPQEEGKEHSDAEEVLELASKEASGKEASVETAPVLSKTEAGQGAGQFAREETKDGPFVGGLDMPADAEIAASQKKTTEVALKDEATEEAEFQENDNTELQSRTRSPPAPAEGERVVQVEGEGREAEPAPGSQEKPEPKAAEAPSAQLVQAVPAPALDAEKDAMGFEESSPWLVPGDAVGADTQGQGSEAALLLPAAAAAKVVGETVQLLETAGTLESADAPLEVEAKPSEKEDVVVQLGEEAVPTGPESRAEPAPGTVPAAPGEGMGADLEGDETTSQKGKPDGPHEQVSRQVARGSEAGEEDVEAANEILQLKTESRKLVQNVIQTVVDQLVSPEERAADGQTPAQLTKADSQRGEQNVDGQAARGLQVSAEDETQATTAREESAVTEQTGPDGPKDVTAAAEEITAVEAEGSSINDQQLEEVALPARGKREVAGTKSVREDGDRAGLGERTEKPLSAAEYPENQTSALEDAEALGDLTKESPDANGPKRKEKEVEFQEGKGESDSEKEIRTQTQEETQGRETQPAAPALTEP
ncbi:PREDICTED: A-kinase anchor protein 12 [Miniopterus natalensis]|uniref:A-kinase anchor protein 12 n=1 Tax=Miniopterus natalensis TaxID=291302 RepID=UPI0007A6B192|nr:PREDICTED: A-kinase anchor protein 12 [Miniopterus natalensis]